MTDPMTITGPFGSSRYGKTENGSLVAIEADDVAWCRDRVFPSQMNLPATADAGKVRLGGFAPALAPPVRP